MALSLLLMKKSRESIRNAPTILTRFLWLPYWRVLSLLTPRSDVLWNPADRTLEVEPFPREAEDWLSTLAESRDAQDVTNAIASARVTDSRAKFRFPPSPEATVTLAHPLSRLMLRVARSSLENDSSLDPDPLWLSAPFDSPLWVDGCEALALTEVRYRESLIRESKHLWLAIDKAGVVTEKAGLSVGPLVESLSSLGKLFTPSSAEGTLVAVIEAACRSGAKAWVAGFAGRVEGLRSFEPSAAIDTSSGTGSSNLGGGLQGSLISGRVPSRTSSGSERRENTTFPTAEVQESAGESSVSGHTSQRLLLVVIKRKEHGDGDE